MADIVSYTEAIANLRRWLAALEATSAGESYSIDGTTLTRQDVETIRAEIQRWHNTVLACEAEQRGQKRPLGAQAQFPAPGAGASGGIVPQSVWENWRT